MNWYAQISTKIERRRMDEGVSTLRRISSFKEIGF